MEEPFLEERAVTIETILQCKLRTGRHVVQSVKIPLYAASLFLCAQVFCLLNIYSFHIPGHYLPLPLKSQSPTSLLRWFRMTYTPRWPWLLLEPGSTASLMYVIKVLFFYPVNLSEVNLILTQAAKNLEGKRKFLPSQHSLPCFLKLFFLWSSILKMVLLIWQCIRQLHLNICPKIWAISWETLVWCSP